MDSWIWAMFGLIFSFIINEISATKKSSVGLANFYMFNILVYAEFSGS